jgi:hypothetical protein
MYVSISRTWDFDSGMDLRPKQYRCAVKHVHTHFRRMAGYMGILTYMQIGMYVKTQVNVMKGGQQSYQYGCLRHVQRIRALI